MCSSPWLIAACHVLLRLLAPRHPSCALCSLVKLFHPPAFSDRGKVFSFSKISETFVCPEPTPGAHIVRTGAPRPFQTQLKVAIYSTFLLYTDVKELRVFPPSRAVGRRKTKLVPFRIWNGFEDSPCGACLALMNFSGDRGLSDPLWLLRAQICAHPPDLRGGPDRTRTCDPALIKRML